MKKEKKWRVDRWPLLAWGETVLKLAGMGFGFYALAAALRAGEIKLPAGPALAQWAILVLLSLGLFAAIVDRLQEREIITMVFVVLNNIAHWGFVVALMAGTSAGLAAFAALFFAGDVVKIMFIRRHQFKVRDVPTRTMYTLTSVYALGYALIILSLLLSSQPGSS